MCLNPRKKETFKTFEMLLRLKMGVKFNRQLMSRFLSKGVTKADLKHDGNWKPASCKRLVGLTCSKM